MARLQLSSEELETMRAHLSDVALGVYRQEGLAGLSFRRLAESAGVSHTLPYRYFDNKEALLARMRTDALARFEVYVREFEGRADKPLAQVESVAQGYMAFAIEHPQDYMLIFSAEQPSPERYPEVLAMRRRLVDHVVDLVQRCIDKGELAGNAREIAHHFWVALHGLLTLHTTDQLVHGMDLEEILPSLIQRLLLGARA